MSVPLIRVDNMPSITLFGFLIFVATSLLVSAQTMMELSTQLSFVGACNASAQDVALVTSGNLLQLGCGTSTLPALPTPTSQALNFTTSTLSPSLSSSSTPQSTANATGVCGVKMPARTQSLPTPSDVLSQDACTTNLVEYGSANASIHRINGTVHDPKKSVVFHVSIINLYCWLVYGYVSELSSKLYLQGDEDLNKGLYIGYGESGVFIDSTIVGEGVGFGGPLVCNVTGWISETASGNLTSQLVADALWSARSLSCSFAC